uniref:C2H2-type domain-containing protein n=1 Tax=Sinocyclocheilus rhinocerous TaxID=307959 RepID=A0A673I933_9TELE
MLQHDNARPHVARICTQFLEAENIPVLAWPAYSPDMSPIEHRFPVLEWTNIPQATINNLINFMRRRCVALREHHVCSKMFMQSPQFMRHKTIHTGEKPFKCPDCNKCFGRASHLKTHRRLHTGEKLFKCTLCERAFTQKAGLIIHLCLHTGECPFKCDKCGKAFRTSSHLLNHQALELGEGRYICATCHKGFSSVSMLKQHEKSHQGSRILCCSTMYSCTKTCLCTAFYI